MIEEYDYTPLNLWIRQDQMDKITKDAYEESTTIYGLIRRMIDYYYENHQGLNEETNSYNESDRGVSVN